MENLNLVTLPHFVSVKDLQKDEVESLIKRAEYFKQGGATPRLTKPVYVTNMFFENSSRTHTSFEMAERKLGLTVIPFDPAHSSVKKRRNSLRHFTNYGCIRNRPRSYSAFRK